MERRKRPETDEAEEKKKKLKDPFLRRQVECPVCGVSVEQLGLKTNLFRNEQTDLDLRPYKFRWEQDNLAKYHPPLYYVWYCPKCYFAAGRKFYEAPLTGSILPMRKFQQSVTEKYKNDPNAKKIINKLTQGITPELLDFKQAFQLHLLAAYWLELFEEFSKRDAMNLARYYIRIAWLFRDISDSEELTRDVGPAVKEFFEDLKTAWPDVVDNEIAAMRKAVHYYEVTLGKSEIIGNAVDELNVLMIVAKIYLKLNDLKPALDALSAAVTSGTRSKQEIDTALRAPQRDAEGGLSDKARSDMAQQSTDLRSLIDRARSMLDKCKDDWIAVQTEKAKGIIADNRNQTRTQLRALLEAEKIEPKVINRLLPLEETKQKKGFFSQLFGG